MGRTKRFADIALGAILFWCFPDMAAAGDNEPGPVPRVQVVTLEGDTLNLADVCEGKPSFVYLWATWCKTCKKDLKNVYKLRDKFGDRIQVFGIAWKNSPEEIQTFFAGRKKALYSYIDSDGRVFEAFETRLTPTVVIVNARGEVLFSGYGSFRKYRKILEKALKG
ncbi:MAG: TlpA disulfide reductase family protein [Gemmatimonadota bacterium]|nr:TlpA disulfide reductase family protein [Gemmatimonadota bacterium]